MTTQQRNGTSLWLVAILPLLAVAQVVAGSLHDLTGLGMSIPDRSAANDTPAVPAVYAFAVWGLIFLWCFAFVGYQATGEGRGSALVARLRGPAALAFTLNAVWEIHAQLFGLGWLSFALIAALLLPLLAIVERARAFDGPIGARETWLTLAPLHILAGWISVAVFASLSTTLDVAGSLSTPAAAAIRDPLLAAVAGLAGATVAWRARLPLAYGLTVIWGLTGIVVKNAGSDGGSAMVVVAALAIAAVGATTLAAARQRKTP